MTKSFAVVLTCVMFLGCQSGGQRLTGSAPNSAAPASSSAPANNAVVNEGTANQVGTIGSGVATAASTFGRIWNAVGFQRPAPTEPAPVSPEIARFNAFVSALTSQTSQLNINDPPEITRQKAQGIMATLRDWDSVLAAGRSIGVINDTTADLMTRSIQRLTTETQKLVQYAPSPQKVEAVRQLGGSLGAVYSNVQRIWTEGSSVSQTLLGDRPQ